MCVVSHRYTYTHGKVHTYMFIHHNPIHILHLKKIKKCLLSCCILMSLSFIRQFMHSCFIIVGFLVCCVVQRLGLSLSVSPALGILTIEDSVCHRILCVFLFLTLQSWGSVFTLISLSLVGMGVFLFFVAKSVLQVRAGC